MRGTSPDGITPKFQSEILQVLRDVPFDAVQEADLQGLVEDRVVEDRYIEFKAAIYGPNDEPKRELLADVSAFANAQGGDLLLGVEDEQGRATRLLGLGSIDTDAEILRIESIVRDGLEPRIPGMSLRAVSLSSGEPLIIIRIPASVMAPHRLVSRPGGKFYRRNNAGKYEMDVQEIRDAFVGSELLVGRLVGLHDGAVAAARETNMPFSMGPLPAAVLSLTPLDYFRQSRDLDLDEYNSQQPFLKRPASSSWMTTLEGTLVHGVPAADAGDVVEGYAHTHRTGRVEAVWRIGGPREVSPGTEKRLVFAQYFEQGPLDQAGTAVERGCVPSRGVGGGHRGDPG